MKRTPYQFMKCILMRTRLLALLMLAAFFSLLQARGQAPSAAPADNVALSALSMTNRAAWQQHMTLGSGDVLSISLFDSGGPREAWPNVIVGPDGRISYLEARDVMAAGYTIDELR